MPSSTHLTAAALLPCAAHCPSMRFSTLASSSHCVDASNTVNDLLTHNSDPAKSVGAPVGDCDGALVGENVVAVVVGVVAVSVVVGVVASHTADDNPLSKYITSRLLNVATPRSHPVPSISSPPNPHSMSSAAPPGPRNASSTPFSAAAIPAHPEGARSPCPSEGSAKITAHSTCSSPGDPQSPSSWLMIPACCWQFRPTSTAINAGTPAVQTSGASYLVVVVTVVVVGASVGPAVGD